ncbi:uncharacterized protein OCT59_026343 [Rhizophagus irregularis]|uniref:uncharacterized protein n=1 Tax=Rhizophagus irregularis TaxID=588596 RepID=UPI00331F4CF1|nr:hypothetical protein OCT59_026343 [Rhizophagus irregularis]
MKKIGMMKEKKARSCSKTTFSRKVSRKNSFTRKKLNKEQLKEFERALEAEEDLAERATSSTVNFTPRHYYKQLLLELLKNTNLRQIWAATNSKSDNAEFWTKVAQFVCYLKVAVNTKSLRRLLLDFQFKEFDKFVEQIPL